MTAEDRLGAELQAETLRLHWAVQDAASAWVEAEVKLSRQIWTGSEDRVDAAGAQARFYEVLDEAFPRSLPSAD